MHRHPARPWPRRREIARRLGRLPSTVSRELRRNLRPHDREIYDGDLAHARARDRARRPLLAQGPELRRTVHNKLHLEWSPAHLAAHRIRIGDWEGHRIVGRMSRSAIGTLVDRRTGFLRLVYLPDGHGVEQLRVATLPVLTGLPVLAGRCRPGIRARRWRATICWPSAFADGIFFAHPSSPWLRGRNENTNGVLHQYSTKGSDLSAFSLADLWTVED